MMMCQNECIQRSLKLYPNLLFFGFLVFALILAVFGFLEPGLKTGMPFANQIDSMEKTLESMRYLLNLYLFWDL